MKSFIGKFHFLGDFLQLSSKHLLLHVFSKRVANDTCSFLSKVRIKDLKFSSGKVSKDKLKSES